MARHFITAEDRYRIEALVKAGEKPAQIARVIGCSERTIWRELRRGRCEVRDSHSWKMQKTYSQQIAQEDYNKKATHKGPALKIGKDYALVAFIEKYIVEYRYSPAAALAELRLQGLQFATSISTTTLYRYIYDGLFLNISASDLIYGPYRRKCRKKVVHSGCARHLLDKHIEERPDEAAARSERGHWEMDTVIGTRSSRTCLLVLSDRCTREEIAWKLKARTSAEVVRALRQIRRKYPEMPIKTITCDNGVEFSDVAGMEQIAPVYFCHPYHSWERGTNEFSNRMIRRFLPKGKSMDKLTHQQAAYITHWMNNYPRKLLGWQRPCACKTA